MTADRAKNKSMAIHTNSAKLSAEVIEESIEHARMGLPTENQLEAASDSPARC